MYCKERFSSILSDLFFFFVGSACKKRAPLLQLRVSVTTDCCRGVEQGLARWAHNPKAGGSNPSPAIFLEIYCKVDLFFLGFFLFGGIAQLVRAMES